MEGSDVLMGCRFVGHPRGEGVKVGAELLVFLADFGELGGDGVELGRDSHYGRDCGTEDGEGGAFTCRDGLEGMRREVLDQVGVELATVPGLRKAFC